ncbi:hypothetical protein [Fusibacillus kribbianus]|uniref:Uncharacterized protein n=1 Tax=Fusibacillus kribbianus TaxID=3044208 RepID=A0AAP4BDW3_9FIRM|nr:hypothetical protein [Ruminococcus sp. YH-rum2234]MDI9243186.1 hypothetical protein [Ruminococcus sp. YH-rum2234]
MNYSNSQRAGVILYLTALLFGGYDGATLDIPEKNEITGIKEALVALKEETYEEKTDFLDFFKSKSSTEPKELVRVEICYFEKWREKAIELIIPIAAQYISENQQNLQNYYDELANQYHEKLSLLHDFKMDEKTCIASQLSEDERMLQADNDWLVALKDQLTKIERG